jgi:site-specific recombinase XerD
MNISIISLVISASRRDRAMFMLMLRCGLRVQEVAHLTMASIDLRRMQLMVYEGKGRKDRVVYLSPDAVQALVDYLRVRPQSRVRAIFLVEKGTCKGKGSLRSWHPKAHGVLCQAKAVLKVSCHQLRHTMATQLLNADADLVTIQDLLGHSRIKTTQRYCKVSNLKVQRDYYKAIGEVMRRHGIAENNLTEPSKMNHLMTI